jgi:hypothetical protein
MNIMKAKRLTKLTVLRVFPIDSKTDITENRIKDLPCERRSMGPGLCEMTIIKSKFIVLNHLRMGWLAAESRYSSWLAR